MKDQLQTLREAVNELHNSFPEKERALTALAQLEAMAGEQKPVAWIRGSGIEMLKSENGGCATVYASEGMSNHSSPLYAAPVAPQPQTELQRYSLDGEGGMETDSLGAWVKLRDVKQQPQAECRNDGRCQYAIDSGAEGLGHCPKGKCVMQQSHAKTAEVFHCKTCGCTMQMPHDDCLACERGAPQQAEAVPCGGRDYCARFPFCGCGDSGSLPERDKAKPAEQQGLFRKFVVRRTDGSDAPGGKHDGCDYFVLDVTHDKHARAALAAYAASVEETHPQLALDMRSRYELAAPQQAEAVPPTHVLVPVAVLQSIAQSSTDQHARGFAAGALAAAKKEAGHG